jgi:hypothetical protein
MADECPWDVHEVPTVMVSLNPTTYHDLVRAVKWQARL